jgi:putrescine transport system ATP-binding protein
MSIYPAADFNNKKKVIVSLENVTKKFPTNDSKTVDNINLNIYEGEFFSLLGPSGCGKTTLLRMIAGFEQPTSGKIFIDDMDMTKFPPYSRPINLMFQYYALFPHMNVEQNIAFGLHQEGLPSEVIRSRVKDVMEMVKLSGLEKRKPSDISGGQQQRVALARSLVKRPKILMLDEPLAALDLKTREHTQLELINIQHMLGITFIMVTHDQEEALAMSSRIAIMDGGEILQIGSPKQIYEYPNSRFVADFIGTINMFSGKVISGSTDGEYMIIRSIEAGCDIVYRTTQKIPTDAEVWMAVRPEEMNISTKLIKSENNQMPGKIYDIGFLGDKISYHVKLHSGFNVAVTVPTSARNKNIDLVVGNDVYVSWHDTDGVVLTE